MFAYCNNNPTNYSDDVGSVPIWNHLRDLAKWGFIHACVEEQIKQNSGGTVESEVWLIRGRSFSGRADIMNYDGDVWEIKHAGKNREIRLIIASLQAISYLGSLSVRLNTYVLSLGDPGAFSGTFVINAITESYQVEYSTDSYGVILYTVNEIPYQENADYYLYEQKAEDTAIIPALIPYVAPVPYVYANTPGCPWGNNRAEYIR